jgi:imidazolonepropionase-like amidohydrolase
MKFKVFIKIFLAVALLLPGFANAQVPAPGKAQKKPVILLGGIAHIGNGQVIENSAIAFENGKITLVADASSAKIDLSKFEVQDILGKHVYPGFILPDTDMGLVEVSAVRSTVDNREVGSFNPNVRSIVAYNTDSELIPTMKFNGILMAQITPIGGIISGSSSIVQLDAWDWEDAVSKTDDGIHLNWPRRYVRTGWWAEPGGTNKNEKYEGTVNQIKEFFDDAVAYNKVSNPIATNLKLKAMRGLFEGSKTLYLHVDFAKDIIESVKFAQSYGIKNVVLVGAEDALYVKDFIKENNLPVLLSNVHRLPGRAEEDVDLPYKLPYLLMKEGILVGLTYSGTTNARNLPFFAGTAAAHGLGKEEALMTITSNVAKIMGVADKVGTLENGKEATLFVSSGDALDMRTNNVEVAFVQGRKITLDSKQQALYQKYKDKFEEDKPVKVIAGAED